MRSSFELTNFCSEKAKAAENIQILSRDLTHSGRKFVIQNQTSSTLVSLPKNEKYIRKTVGLGSFACSAVNVRASLPHRHASATFYGIRRGSRIKEAVMRRLKRLYRKSIFFGAYRLAAFKLYSVNIFRVPSPCDPVDLGRRGVAELKLAAERRIVSYLGTT